MEDKNTSPWLDAPGVSQAFPTLKEDLTTDIAVVGGWIAGVMTAYFLLHDTDYAVVLLEGNKVAHAATGHNAGQIDVFFETPLDKLVKRYGTEMTRNAYQAMFDAWQQLEEVITRIEWQGYYTKYTGYNVYTSKEQVDWIIAQTQLFSSLGLEINELFLNADAFTPAEFSAEAQQCITRISSEKGSDYIGSSHLGRLAFEAGHYATLNSAALSHAVLAYLLATYPDRFSVYEHALVDQVNCEEHDCTLSVGSHVITCKETILATNAFQHHRIGGKADIIPFEQVRGYMAGYLVPGAAAPKTICYEPPGESYTDGYFYQTTRHYIDTEFADNVLLTLGWPEEPTATAPAWFPLRHKHDLDQYVKTYYNKEEKGEYYRRGDMCYTSDGMRKIGPHPAHLHIRYNLGCNGVGILPSVHGGWKIAQYLLGNVKEKSVFDLKTE